MIPQLEKIFSVVVEIRTKAEIKIRTIQNLEKQEKLEVAQLAIEKSQIEFLAQSLEEAISEVEKMGAVLKGLDPLWWIFPSS
ncbi:MAG: DUF2203 family protein [Elusimicrobia bacterium]|nr:DUF2203 family protein [Elusimicrobiota bacterium]